MYAQTESQSLIHNSIEEINYTAPTFICVRYVISGANTRVQKAISKCPALYAAFRGYCGSIVVGV